MKLAQKLAIGWLRAKLHLTGVLFPRLACRLAMRMFCTPFRKTRKKEPGVFKKAERVHIDFEGTRCVGFRWNPEGEQRVLIAHGFESSSYNFDRYVMPLVKAGCCVVAFDAPAHGLSSGKRINVVQYSHFLRAVAEKYGSFDGVLAHSFGGLATALWQEEAEHNIHKIVLIAPATETQTAVNTFIRFFQLPPRISRCFIQELENLAGKSMEWFSVARAIGHIKADVLWIHDEEDKVTPLSDVHPVMQTEHPHVRFLITKGWGHRQIYRENKVLKAAVSFLTE